jgi:hypothetical protein
VRLLGTRLQSGTVPVPVPDCQWSGPVDGDAASAPSPISATRTACASAGTGAGLRVVVVDADGADAAALVERLLAQAGVDARTVPQAEVQTQRGPDGRRWHSESATTSPPPNALAP